MNQQFWFSFFAISQGAFVSGLTMFILLYYLPKTKGNLKEKVRWQITLGAASYILLTLATIKTAAFQLYDWGDIWYWAVTLAYIGGDIAILIIFREAIKSTYNDNK